MSTELDAALERESDWGKRLELIRNALCPPEPHLLDTCVLQNLDWVDRREETKTIPTEDELANQFGRELAIDLIALAILYRNFQDRSGYPWLVCNTAVAEAQQLGGQKGKSLRSLIAFFEGHEGEWSAGAYPGIATGLLRAHQVTTRVSPLILRGLGVATAHEACLPNGPLGFLPDNGDRLLAAEALFANVPVILTTDRRTFWAHRDRLLPLGVEVLRPSELLDLYDPYWAALDTEFNRRRREQPRPNRNA